MLVFATRGEETKRRIRQNIGAWSRTTGRYDSVGVYVRLGSHLDLAMTIHKNSPNGTEFRRMMIRSEPGPFQGGHKPTGRIVRSTPTGAAPGTNSCP